MDTFSPIIRHAAKGGAIRKAGFLTGIHALAPVIKNKLDELLLRRYAPERALSILEKEYPNTNLPSKSAVYTYKSKFLPPFMTNSRQVSLNVEKLDVEKMSVASLYLSHLRRFIAIDLNVLQDRWYKRLEQEQETGEPQKATNELGKMYMEGIKLGMDMLLRLNVNFDTLDEKESDTEEEDQDFLSDAQKQKIFIIQCQAAYEWQQAGGKLNDLNSRLARLYEWSSTQLKWQLELKEQQEAKEKENNNQPISS